MNSKEITKSLEIPKKIWRYLKKDTWDSWLVSIIIVVVLIKFVFFPVLSLATGTSLPIVVVESCSMYHNTGNFDNWWQANGAWYIAHGINKTEFQSFPFSGGLNKGDIVFVTGGTPHIGDIIIFNSPEYPAPIIHRVVSTNPYETKGDNNPSQIPGIEFNIEPSQILGVSQLKIPYIGWLKLIFYEPFRQTGKGLCT